MRYELVNRYYGTKVIAESEKVKDHFLANVKKSPEDGKPVWKVLKELPDQGVPTREGEFLSEIERLKKELQDLKGGEVASIQAETSDETPEDTGSTPVSSTTSKPKKKAVKKTNKKLGDPGSSI